MDFIHRLVSPETYPCRLCDLTYGRVLKKAGWRRFVASLHAQARDFFFFDGCSRIGRSATACARTPGRSATDPWPPAARR